MLSDPLFLLIVHSLLRWLVVASLACSIYRAWRGLVTRSVFSKLDNSVRHWTATLGHMQLIVGVLLYVQSPVVRYFWRHVPGSLHQRDTVFFGVIHGTCMLAAVAVLTIGSALAKRRPTDREKFRTMLTWFLAALIIILIFIPWPFSPLAARPYSRSF